MQMEAGNNRFNSSKLAFRVKEVAEMLGLGESTIRRLIRAKSLGHFVEGRAVLISRKHLDEYLESRNA